MHCPSVIFKIKFLKNKHNYHANILVCTFFMEHVLVLE